MEKIFMLKESLTKIFSIKQKYKFFIILILLLISFIFYLKIFFKKTPQDISNKHLVVYGSLREEEGKYLLESFKKKYGCTYEYIKLPTEETVKRILDKKENPKGDIFIGGTCDGYEILKHNNALESYTSINSNNIPIRYKDIRGFWTGFQVTPLAIGINKELWNSNFKNTTSLPKNFNDLLNPKFKGKIIIPNPTTSGTGYTFMASLYQQLGYNKFHEFIVKLNKNISSTTISGFNSIQRVSSGQYLITVNFLSDQLIENKSTNNIISIIPDKTGWNVDSVALIKNSKNQDCAKAFIDFVLSDDIQKKLSRFSKAISTKDFDEKQFKIYKDYDFSLAATNRKEIMNIISHIEQ